MAEQICCSSPPQPEPGWQVDRAQLKGDRHHVSPAGSPKPRWGRFQHLHQAVFPPACPSGCGRSRQTLTTHPHDVPVARRQLRSASLILESEPRLPKAQQEHPHLARDQTHKGSPGSLHSGHDATSQTQDCRGICCSLCPATACHPTGTPQLCLWIQLGLGEGFGFFQVSVVPLW